MVFNRLTGDHNSFAYYGYFRTPNKCSFEALPEPIGEPVGRQKTRRAMLLWRIKVLGRRPFAAPLEIGRTYYV